MKTALFYLFLGFPLAALGRPTRYKDDSKVYVHVVPHTHDDVGWLKTVDEYYYGSNKTLQPHSAVQYILDTVVQELQLDESRTFVYVEIAFFARWWREQSEATRNIVKQLVAKKQLEFLNAGWCMNDEAATHYNAIIDQMTLGLRFVEETFGPEARPRVAWHIDPFGHSSGMATLLAQMGFDSFFFARDDYADYKKRMNDSTLEMVWRSSPIFGRSSDLFTGILYDMYGPPNGFCFDVRCTDDPVKDNPDLFDYNVDDIVKRFLEAIYDQKAHYRTNHIMLTMGSDFQYESARENFKNLDKLIKYTMERNSSVEVFYSTPSRYMDALYQTNLSWTVKTDDFFPYADSPHSFWTGYFTSRPALKGYVREMNSLLQSCKQLDAFGRITRLERTTTVTTRRLKEAMGVAQHHDAVSGTEKQHVAYDYAMRLHMGAVECQKLIHDVIGAAMTLGTAEATPPSLVFCEYLNVSMCAEVERESSFNVVVYNPLTFAVPLTLWIPQAYEMSPSPPTVQDSNGMPVTAQIQTVSQAVQSARHIRGDAKYELVINDVLLPMSYKTYFVRQDANLSSPSSSSSGKVVSIAKEASIFGANEDIIIGTSPVQVVIDGTTGRLKAINNTESDVFVKVDQAFMWYASSDGVNMHTHTSSQASGAYIFRPNDTRACDCDWNSKVLDQTIIKGSVYTEFRQQFNESIYQTIRVYNDRPYVEFDYVVGPIYPWDFVGKEVISRFSTDLDTEATWYTDANGREMQKRIRDYRPTWKLNSTEPVSQNYYPVNSRIYLKDEKKGVQFTVFTDRSQGGSSMNDGQLELMVHRRLFRDDGKGVAEPLDEPGQFGKGLIIRGKHYVLVDSISRSNFHRRLGQHFMLRPHVMFFVDKANPKEFVEKYHASSSFLNDYKALPVNLHILTLEAMDDHGNYLLRLENFEEQGGPANVTLASLFVVKISSVVELTLAGNAQAPIDRLKWKTIDAPSHKGYSKSKTMHHDAPQKPDFQVILYPMEIQTFQVTFDS